MKRLRLGIVGLGLIGGSLARALKGKRGAPEVWGFDKRRESVRMALECGAIAKGATEREIAGCDVVVVCVPVRVSVGVIERIGRRMRAGSILTDAGSVKAEVVAKGRAAVAEGVSFVGGHPIAGTENSGFPAADPALFKGRTAIVTPCDGDDAVAVGIVEKIWRLAGARVLRMDPVTHDHVFAYVSHLPHVVAYALVHAVGTLDTKVPLGYAAGGFRDFTRIASSNPAMWKDIVLQNRPEMLRALAHYRKNLALIEGLIRQGDEAEILAYFGRAKKIRDGI
ncbi:MAG TPA: prephenate dehydrogenase/arogenate dehydrogenase family protein [Candidatus Deferrimicrobiaceae bacterium]